MMNMSKEKRGKMGIVIVITASLLLTGLFGLALMGANRLAFANAANRTIEIQPETMSVSQGLNATAMSTAGDMGMTIAKALSAEAAPRRQLNIIETFGNVTWPWGDSRDKNENTLTAEEAAQIGAQYIYEIFGVCIDGFTLQMTYNGMFRHRETLGTWTGTVGDGIMPEGIFPEGFYVDMPLGTPMFLFMLNAESGEAIHVEQIGNIGEGITILTPRSEVSITIEFPYIHGFGEPWSMWDIFGDMDDWNTDDIESWYIDDKGIRRTVPSIPFFSINPAEREVIERHWV
jgi:hypothetical protein